ncbi:MAG: DUF4302 domain-containing protein [Prevotella sp.]|nr:DUF4302 domain-containing protein [Prevotella sp.]
MMLLASCADEVDNVFGQSASNRVADSQAAYYTILEGQQQGWVLDYYPSDRSLGGVAYTARFKDGEVTMTCEQAVKNTVTSRTYPVGTEVASLYRIVNETGILLTFDTYNPLFHYWSQPYQGHAKGYESDYEFTFLSACADSVVLKGKKHGNLLRMFPLRQTAADYVKQVANIHTALGSTTRKRAVIEGQTTHISMSDNLMTYADNGQSHTVSFVYTPDGLRFYEPVTLGGVSVSQLTFNSGTDELCSADSRIVLPTPTTAERFTGTKKQWFFGYHYSKGASDMCDELRDIITDCAKQTSGNYGEQVRDIYLGANMENASTDPHRMVLGWHTRVSGINLYIGYAIGMEMADDQRQLISIQMLEGANLFYNYSYWQPFVDFIGNNSPYLPVFDSQDNPTQVTLTSEKDSGKWFTLKLNK